MATETLTVQGLIDALQRFSPARPICLSLEYVTEDQLGIELVLTADGIQLDEISGDLVRIFPGDNWEDVEIDEDDLPAFHDRTHKNGYIFVDYPATDAQRSSLIREEWADYEGADTILFWQRLGAYLFVASASATGSWCVYGTTTGSDDFIHCAEEGLKAPYALARQLFPEFAEVAGEEGYRS